MFSKNWEIKLSLHKQWGILEWGGWAPHILTLALDGDEGSAWNPGHMDKDKNLFC